MWRPAKKNTYLDWAASAPTSRKASHAFRVHEQLYGNPGALHKDARAGSRALEDARTRIARLAQIKTTGVVFTSGATEANALAIIGSIEARARSGIAYADIHVLYHPSAHSSLVGAVEMLTRKGVQTQALALRDGVPDITLVRAQLRPTTCLISLEAVSGETGTIFETRELRRLIDTYTKDTQQKILLHVDASQAPRVLAFSLTHLGAHLLSLDAQKVGGVRGIGALLLTREASVAPGTLGGGQEGGLRPGTQNPALAQAFAVALEEVSEMRERFIEEHAGYREELLSQISTIATAVRNESKHQASHIVNISLLGRDTDYLVMLLDAQGFSVSTKSACETDEPGSRMVLAMSGDKERALSTLRISWGPGITKKELMRFATELKKTVRFLDEKAIY